MSLVGKLEDLGLAEILQLLSVSEKTGKLTLTCRDGSGLIVFRQGRIIYAASNSAREAFGHILVCSKLIDEASLAKALQIQHRSREEKRLGSILIGMKVVTAQDLEGVLRQQTQKIISELLRWEGGFFKFEPLAIPERGEVSVDAREFLLESGLNAEQVALEFTSSSDQAAYSRQLERPGAPDPREVEAGVPKGGRAAVEPSLATLKSIMEELRSPAFTGEITLRILHYASGVAHRCLLLSITKDGIQGMGQLGLDSGGDPERRVRGIRIPVDEPSVFTDVIGRRETFRGALSGGRWNEYLVGQLGGAWPLEAIVIPMVFNNSVIALLYGDNQQDDGPIGNIAALEVLMLEAGLAMEKAALEIRVRSLQERLARRGAPVRT